MQRLLPEGYEVDPEAQPTVLFDAMHLRKLPWLNGRGSCPRPHLTEVSVLILESRLQYFRHLCQRCYMPSSNRRTHQRFIPARAVRELYRPHPDWTRGAWLSVSTQPCLLCMPLIFRYHRKIWAELPDVLMEDNKLVLTAVSLIQVSINMC